jgi:hypothetical protein
MNCGERTGNGARSFMAHGRTATAGTNNVIYDRQNGRARLIDFEIIHQKSLPAKSRHAGDLLVFLLDLMAVAPNRQWLTPTTMRR